MSRIRVTLKLATSLDGKIALSNGESEWVTGEAARKAGRALRGKHDAIAIGSGTAITDNPQLTTRLGDAPNPIRVVFDTRLRLRADSNLAQTANETPVIVMTDNGSSDHANSLKALGVRVVEVPLESGHVAIKPALEALARMGVDTFLLEGGGHLAAAFLRAGCVDQLEWFTAPILIGGDGRACVAALELSNMADVYRFERVAVDELGPDLHETFTRSA